MNHRIIIGFAVLLLVAAPSVGEQTTVSVCSFNIMWLGHYTKKLPEPLADLLKDYDIVVVQELVAPPVDGIYPDGTTYTADEQSAAFFAAMSAHGFDSLLSEEDTGTNPTIHIASPGTEWFTTFFKPDKVHPTADLPSGFLADDRSDHADYERVPYAFAFQTDSGHTDFVLISVHLQPDSTSADRERRKHELATIAQWVDDHDDQEGDFIILGDMNLHDAAELADAIPAGFVSLNDDVADTTTSPTTDRPYDHVMYRPATSQDEIDTAFDFQVLDLVAEMEGRWDSSLGPYPGDPYDHDEFKQRFSDHYPVVFRIIDTETDDDGAPSIDAVLNRIDAITRELEELRAAVESMR